MSQIPASPAVCPRTFCVAASAAEIHFQAQGRTPTCSLNYCYTDEWVYPYLPDGRMCMSLTVEAVYEDGLLKPVQPLPLAQHSWTATARFPFALFRYNVGNK